MKFLPDTNVIINFFKNIDPDLSFMKKALNDEEVFFSPIVLAELAAGASPKEKKDLLKLSNEAKVVEIGDKTAFIAGDYRVKLNRLKDVYLLDCLIAASAKEHNLVLVTNNVRDYQMKDIKIIKPKL